MPLDWLPAWDATEWAAIGSAVFTAAAAIAAWLSARASLASLRAARVPFVSGAILQRYLQHPLSPLSVTFANAGPTLAVQVMYLLVGPGYRHGGMVREGHLTVGQEVTIETPYYASSDPEEKHYLVWALA